MAAYLDRHPSICMGPKETHQFGSDLRHPDTEGQSLEAYLSSYDKCGNVSYYGDASVFYLSSQRAYKEIHEYNPSARIIIMLRNPADMMYSWYSQSMWMRRILPSGPLDPDSGQVMTFEEMLDSEEERVIAWKKIGDPLAAQGMFQNTIYSTKGAMYYDDVAKYLNTFDKLHVEIYEDFKEDSVRELRRVLSFLGLPPVDDTAMYRPVNQNRNIQSMGLHRVLNSHHEYGAARKVWRSLVPQRVRKGAHRLLQRRNVHEAPRPPMKSETRARLNDHFREDVKRLSSLIGRDLNAVWLKP